MKKVSIRSSRVSGFPAPTSLAIRSGNLLFLSGMAAHNLEGKIVGVGDADAQTRQALDNLAALMEEVGGTLDDIVKLTVFVQDIADRPTINKVRAEYFHEPFPAATLIQVSRLAREGALVEIEAIAVVRA